MKCLLPANENCCQRRRHCRPSRGALAALRAGNDVQLRVLRPCPDANRRRVQIAPNGWDALSALGIADALLPHANSLADITLRDLASGATLARLDLDGPYASIDRGALIRCLDHAVNAKRDPYVILHGIDY